MLCVCTRVYLSVCRACVCLRHELCMLSACCSFRNVFKLNVSCSQLLKLLYFSDFPRKIVFQVGTTFFWLRDGCSERRKASEPFDSSESLFLLINIPADHVLCVQFILIKTLRHVITIFSQPSHEWVYRCNMWETNSYTEDSRCFKTTHSVMKNKTLILHSTDHQMHFIHKFRYRSKFSPYFIELLS